MNQYLQVEGKEGLVRDPKTDAIININNNEKFKIVNHYFGQDERRFKKLGYLGMLWYMIVNFFNRHNLQHFEKAKVNYWD